MENRMARVKSFLKSFTPYQITYLVVVCALTFGFVIFFPDLVLDSTESTLVTVCSVITVIANPVCELLISKQSKLNFVVDFFFIELTYLVIALTLGWYTLALTVVFFWMPIDVISYVRWSKHPDEEDENLTQVKRLKPAQAVMIVGLIVVFGLVAGYGMPRTHTLSFSHQPLAWQTVFCCCSVTASSGLPGSLQRYSMYSWTYPQERISFSLQRRLCL